MISIVIPSHNNLRHLKNAYQSIKKHAPNAEIVLLDDASTDGTWEWIIGLDDPNVIPYKSPTRDGHTVLYDLGIQLATNDIVGIMHADMIMGQNYVENVVKHLKPGVVVCGTRIEPPLHPSGPEKIVQNFGLDFDSLNIEDFEKFVSIVQSKHKDETTKGMFAPWVIYKTDFTQLGGHDWGFAPFPYEDSDIFQRWILAGYKLIQSRDAFVYHLTCRGHRWTDTIGQDDDYFKVASARAARNYIRKWGSWIKNDELQHPIIPSKYNIGLHVTNCNMTLLQTLEPWCDRIYIDDGMQVLTNSYIETEQPNTLLDLTKRVFCIGYNDPAAENDIVVAIDGNTFTQLDFQYIQILSEILQDSGQPGTFRLGNCQISIVSLNATESDLIVCKR
jgi:glycosyltransferase involved in cell wall biosynthesis